MGDGINDAKKIGLCFNYSIGFCLGNNSNCSRECPIPIEITQKIREKIKKINFLNGDSRNDL